MGSKDDLLDFSLESLEPALGGNEVMTNDQFSTNINPPSIDNAETNIATAAPEQPQAKSKKMLYTMIGMVAVLLIAISVLFIITKSPWKKVEEPAAVEPTKDTTTLANTDVLLKKDTVAVASTDKNITTITNPADAENAKEVTTKIESSKIVSETIDKWGLTRPCYIISYSGFAAENKAQGDVALLKSSGYNTGYYWIPDYKANGNKFYKVYVGPYKTKKDARKKLLQIRQKSPKAYVMKVDLK